MKETLMDQEATLESWLDGRLDDDSQVEVAQRLAADPSFRRALAEKRDLRQRISRLPREVSPPGDLWPGIEARLHVEGAPSHQVDFVGEQGSPTGWQRQLLAAAIGSLIGGLLAYAALTGGVTSPADASSKAETSVEVADSTVGDSSDFRTVGLGASDLAMLLESDFLRARETLWVSLLAKRDHLPPEAWEVVVENLAILDAAIRDLRMALGEDPGNRRLEKMLLSNHQRQLDLLHRLAREV